MKNSCIFVAVLLCSFLSACQTGGVIQTSPDTYKVGRKSAGGIFTDTAKLRDEVIQEANAFAAAKGKIAVEVASHSEHPLVGGLPSFYYEFRLADKGSDQAATAKPADLSSEILKLDDLRKKGLITDGEYEAQKQKLLNQKK